MTPDHCPHDCYLCVTESMCERDHRAALGVCDKHIKMLLEQGTSVGYVMRRTGGRANPQRVDELAREMRTAP